MMVSPLPALAQTCEEIGWRQLFPEVAPPEVSDCQLVYDSQRQRSVIVVPGDPSRTWEWDGTNWSVAGFGGPNDGYAGAYDSVNAVTVLLTNAGQTWTWDGDQWRFVTNQGPGSRGSASMAFDSDRGVAVLFGGSYLRDTWEWDGAAWTLRSNPPPDDESTPPPRTAASMCYDTVRHRTLLCCGDGPHYERYYDAWLWDGTQWTPTTPLPYSAGRLGAAMAFDSARGRAVLFGGATGHLQDYWFGDTWEFDGTSWTQVATTGPSPRTFPTMAYDAARNNIVLFSGAGQPNDTWIRGVQVIHGGPVIQAQPADQTVDLGGTASFSVVATGEGTITYQWRHNMTPLVDDRHVAGAHTPTLTVSGVGADDAGVYDVVVTNPCDSATSDPANLTVVICPADFNTDGVVNSQDFFDYLNAFFTHQPSADFDHSGTINSNDFFAFLDAFYAGCVG